MRSVATISCTGITMISSELLALSVSSSARATAHVHVDAGGRVHGASHLVVILDIDFAAASFNTVLQVRLVSRAVHSLLDTKSHGCFLDSLPLARVVDSGCMTSINS